MQFFLSLEKAALKEALKILPRFCYFDSLVEHGHIIKVGLTSDQSDQ